MGLFINNDVQFKQKELHWFFFFQMSTGICILLNGFDRLYSCINV